MAVVALLAGPAAAPVAAAQQKSVAPATQVRVFEGPG